jgi:hypothetical protein
LQKFAFLRFQVTVPANNQTCKRCKHANIQTCNISNTAMVLARHLCSCTFSYPKIKEFKTPKAGFGLRVAGDIVEGDLLIEQVSGAFCHRFAVVHTPPGVRAVACFFCMSMNRRRI